MRKPVITAIIIIAVVIVLLMIFPPASWFKLATGVKEMREARKAKLEEAKPQEEIAQVKIYTVATAPFEDVLNVLGTVKGEKQVDLRFEISGIINSINFREGDPIGESDIIAALDQKDTLLKLEFNKSKLKAAEATAKAAEKKLQINTQLYEIGAIIKSKLEEMELEYEAAEAQAESARKEADFAQSELDKTYLTAPMNGVMGTRDAEVGEYVTPQTKIGSMFAIGEVYVEIGVIEKDISRIGIGQNARVYVDAYPDKEFLGTVNNIPSYVEGKSRTIPCKVRLDNPGDLLKPGMFARSDIYVFKEEYANIVPVVALFDSNGDEKLDALFVIEDETAKQRNVETGYITTDYAQIVYGVNDGDRVVVETNKKLEDGMNVKVIETVTGM